jgi:CHAD domain-containing protein
METTDPDSLIEVATSLQNIVGQMQDEVIVVQPDLLNSAQETLEQWLSNMLGGQVRAIEEPLWF